MVRLTRLINLNKLIMLHNSKKALLCATLFLATMSIANAQTPVSGFYPQKNELTVAPSYSYKNSDQFYRGATLNDGVPADLGEISSSIVNLYGEYGILDWLSATITLPYISVQSETGNPDPIQNTNQVEGVQDLGMFMKARAFEKNFDDSSRFSLGGAAGVSLPVGDYEGAGVLSLGNQSTSVDGNAMVQYTTNFKLFTEVQAGYSMRSSSDFEIPNALLYSVKVGYYNDWIYAHAQVGIQNSLSGLDIGTPEFAEAGGAAALPETEVDYTNLSFDVYTPIYKETLGVSAGYGTTLDGRNFNKESAFTIGLVYKAY